MQTFKGKIQVDMLKAKQNSVNILLITNAFVWYYCIIILLQNAAANVDQWTNTLVWVLHFGGIGFSALFGALAAKKIKKRSTFILYWMLAGAIISSFSIFLDFTSMPIVLLFSLFFGVALGFGMPSCMGYFSETVTVERRGLFAGIIFLITGIIITALGTVSVNNIMLQTIILSGWRWFGVIAFLSAILCPVKEQLVETKPARYKSILTQKSFLLYLIPWTLFSLIAYLSLPVQNTVIDYIVNVRHLPMLNVEALRGIENILTAISAVLGGFLADRVGRKRIAMLGFAMLGLGYAFVGLQPYEPITWFLYTFFDGFALGILYVIFVITIWSDLSNGLQSEKFYAIGVLPFFISFLLRLTASTEIASNVLGQSIFPFVAVFLFIAVLPLVYAPETLPDKVMKDRDLKSYIEKAKQKAQKEEKKNGKKDKNQDSDSELESEANKESEDYKKASELAGKYY